MPPSDPSWTMTVTNPDGTTLTFTGTRSFVEMMEGIKKYMEDYKLKQIKE